VLYWIEGLVTVLLAAAKALFAERGSPGLPAIEPLHELRENANTNGSEYENK
jgi:hypothetical protein